MKFTKQIKEKLSLHTNEEALPLLYHIFPVLTFTKTIKYRKSELVEFVEI